MSFVKWLLKELDRATESILGVCLGVLATVGAISITNVKAGFVIMAILITLLYLERN